MRAGLSDDELAVLATQAAGISWKEMKDSEKARSYFDHVQKINPESEELHAFMKAFGPGGKSEAKGEKPSSAKRANALMAAIAVEPPTNGAPAAAASVGESPAATKAEAPSEAKAEAKEESKAQSKAERKA